MSFISDTFTETSDTDITSHVSDSGHHWAYSDDDISLGLTTTVKGSLGYATPESNGGATLIVSTDDSPSSADYAVSITGNVSNVLASAPVIAVYARALADNSEYYILSLHYDGTWQVAKANTTPPLDSGTISSFNDLIDHTLVLHVVGSVITSYIDGVVVSSVTDTEFSSANHVGFGVVALLDSLLGGSITSLSAEYIVSDVVVSLTGETATSAIGDLTETHGATISLAGLQLVGTTGSTGLTRTATLQGATSLLTQGSILPVELVSYRASSSGWGGCSKN
jgi:hypothetical protein